MARVLVLDDDVAILRLLGLRLGREHVVIEETDPQKAILGIMAGERFDVIFSDLNMPEMGGIAFHAAISRIDLEQARRIVFITGRPVLGLPNPCIPKPFNLTELRAIIGGFLPIRLMPRESGLRRAVDGYRISTPALARADLDVATAQRAVGRA